ncbi:VOC family protein [Flavobacterium flavigenum]|uniref:VOC family protein n=1 Tax=Flavobacterium flavigenum TaxID=3003258 RepID=UPI0022ABC7B3|nr:VOC family protein [Flavobacterium flavigenum]
MKKRGLNILVAITVVSFIGCGNSQQNTNNNGKIDTKANQSTTDKSHMIKQKITPNIWVETTDAKAVADYYLSIFKDGKLKEHHKYTNPAEAGGGNFETATIEVAGMELSILAAGPFFKFNESVSLVINCKDQAEVDYYWNALTANGGQESSCGWCKDKYGLSWQVVPVEYFDLINSKDPRVREKAMKNTLTQKKIILSQLQ